MTRLARVWSLAACLTLLSLALPAAARTAPEGHGLQVEFLLPQGTVERITQVVVRFSRDMRPLGRMAQEAAGAPLEISPRPAGTFRWLDPRTLAYLLDRPLVGATRLKLVVPAGVRSLDGAVLARAVKGWVQTPPVMVTTFRPKPGHRLGPRPEIRVTFNQPVELASLARRTWFRTPRGRVRVRVQEETQPAWMREEGTIARTYRIVPVRDLPGKVRIVLHMDPGLRPARGTLPSRQAFTAVYRGYGPLALTKWEMERGPGGPDPQAPLLLGFNNPLRPDALRRHLIIHPKVTLEPPDYPTTPSRWVYLHGNFRPRTLYQVTIRAGLRDAYGTVLKKPVRFSFRTGALPPLLALAGGRGVLESTRRPLYPLRLRNLRRLRAALAWIPLERAVPALVAEQERDWDHKPPPPAPGPHTRVHELSFPPGKLPPDQTKVFPLDLERLLGRRPQGGLVLIDLRATWPDRKGRPRPRLRRALVEVTDLGLTLKLGRGRGAVWVTRLSTGRPLAGVHLELRDRTNRRLWQGVSDRQGLARLPSLAELDPAPNPDKPWLDPQVFLLARRGEETAVLPAAWGEALFWSLPPELDHTKPEEAPALRAHLITQLPLYQPGQEVRFVVYLRRLAPGGLGLPGGEELRLEVRDPYDRVVHSFRGRPDDYGSLAGSFRLTPGARLGRYLVVVIQKDDSELAAGSFRVASFRPPDFRVELRAPRSQVGSRAGAPATLSAAYLFGTPVAQGRATVQVEQEPAEFAPPRLKDYAVGAVPPPDQEPPLRKHLATLTATLDARGRARLSLPAAEPLPGFPVRVGLAAAVADASGRAVKTWRGYLVHPAAVYLGIETPVVARAGRAVAVRLAAATWDDRPVRDLAVEVTAYRLWWETVRERGPGGFWRHLSRQRRRQVWRKRLTLGEKPTQVRFTPPEAGTYLVVAQARDRAGRLSRSSTYLWAAGAGLAGWRRYDDHRLVLKAQPSRLRPGQTARILVQNPFPRATALISLERAGVRRIMVRTLTGPAPVIEVSVRPEDAPNLYLGVLLVRGRSAPPPASGPDLGRPQVRIGYLELTVDDPQAGLAVKVTPERQTLRPGETVRAQVEVRDRAGRPVQARVTFLAVDQRVLVAAGGRDNYDPRRTFYRPRPLAVWTADLRTQVLGRRQYGLKGEAEAGGGGRGQVLRRRFHPAVYWLARGSTDAQGRLAVSFRLPDSLTAYRLVAVAADRKGGFGLGRASVRARRPLQMLSALPRFAVRGDRFTARVVVQNLTSQAGRVEVSARGEGLRLVGSPRREIDLAPGQSRAVGFSVEALRPGEATLTLRARMGRHQDAARFTLPVLPAVDLTHVAAAGSLDPTRGEDTARVPLKLPARAQPGRGGLVVTVAPSPAAALGPPLRLLASYPWDCLEQRMAKAAALAWRHAAGRAWGLPPRPDDLARAQELVDTVADFQTGSGGLRFWPGVGRADLMLTAFVLTALDQMRPLGVKVPAEVGDKALDYLERSLRLRPPPEAEEIGRRLAESFALRLLARHGRKVRALVSAAVQRRENLPPFALACLMEAARAVELPRASQEILQELMATAQVTTRGFSFAGVAGDRLKTVMGSTLRGNAMALWALSRLQPRFPRLGALAAWVARRLAGEPTLSTQEAVFGLWALSSYLARAGRGEVAVAVELAGRELARRRFASAGETPLRVEVDRNLLAPGRTQEVTLHAQGRGQPFWVVRLDYAPERPPRRPANAGFTLDRLYRPAKPALGQEVTCLLTVMVPDTRHHVVVFDPFPAGLEPVGAARGRPVGALPEERTVWRWAELRKDGLMLYAPRLEPGIYTFRYRLRAVAPGGFVARPGRVSEMYAPETFGRTGSGRLVVR